MQHTAEEEEALVPLVRNRRHRARADQPPADKEQAIEVPGDGKTSLSCGRGVSARVRDMFHVRDGSSRQLYAMISLEVSTLNLFCNRILIILHLQVSLLVVCCVLLYWCYHYPSWFHYQVKLCSC